MHVLVDIHIQRKAALIQHLQHLVQDRKHPQEDQSITLVLAFARSQSEQRLVKILSLYSIQRGLQVDDCFKVH